MRNSVQRGLVLDVALAPAGGYTSGNAYVVGEFVGVATTTVLINQPCALWISGVYELPKIVGAITQGQILYWDPAANSGLGALTTVAGSLKRAGTAWIASLSGDATTQVKLMW